MVRSPTFVIPTFVVLVSSVLAQTQTPPAVTRLAVLKAEDRRAASAGDLAVIRSGTRSGDPQTARIAVRALGRLERPALVADIVPFLKHSLSEIRSEAATALGQALTGATGDAASAATAVIEAFAARLGVEADAAVRSAIFDALGRSAVTAAQAERVESMLVDGASHESSIDGRLGIASGFEALVRLHRRDRSPSPAAVDAMRSMVSVTPGGRRPPDPFRDVRVRRVALEALVTAETVDEATLARALPDPDPQVRRLAMRAATAPGAGENPRQ